MSAAFPAAAPTATRTRTPFAATTPAYNSIFLDGLTMTNLAGTNNELAGLRFEQNLRYGHTEGNAGVGR